MKKPGNRQTSVNYVRRSQNVGHLFMVFLKLFLKCCSGQRIKENITNPFIKNTSVTVKTRGIYLNKNFTRIQKI